jgi:hypothetical protein
LLRFRHLNEGGVLLVEEDLDPLDVAVHAEQNKEVIALSLGKKVSNFSLVDRIS